MNKRRYENSLTCQCGELIEFGHHMHRGLLINLRASTASGLMTMREQLASLRKKKWSKQFVEQHKKDIETMKALEARIANDEKSLIELNRINEECYG